MAIRYFRPFRATGGDAESATDPEILDAIRLLASTEGVFTEPAGGTTLASTIKLIQRGIIPPDEAVCGVHHRERFQDDRRPGGNGA